jgi:hypothetical protein
LDRFCLTAIEQETVFFGKEQQDRGRYLCHHDVDESATSADHIKETRPQSRKQAMGLIARMNRRTQMKTKLFFSTLVIGMLLVGFNGSERSDGLP